MEQPQRIDFIDLTKGLCIVLVVVVHTGGAFSWLESNAIITSFCMPLYFFVSGLFFKSYSGFKEYIAQKIVKLLIPFSFFYVGSFLLMYLVWRIRPDTFQLPVQFSELLLVFQGHDLIRFNPPIWFLVALFNCNLLFYVIHYLRKSHLSLLFSVTAVIGVVGFWLGKSQIELPFYIDVAMTALPFYVAGFWIRRYNFFLYPHHRFDKLIPLFLLFACTIFYFTARPVGMRTNSYEGNLLQFYAAAFAGIFAIMLICKWVRKAPLISSYLGRYSIITLGLHGPLLHFLRPLVTKYVACQWLQSSLLLLLALGICLLVTPLLVKYMPYLVAHKKYLETVE